jgi:hypothetical protein
MSKLANQNRKGVSRRRETDMYAHTQKQKLYMVLGMDVESQMEEPNEKSIVKSG